MSKVIVVTRRNANPMAEEPVIVIGVAMTITGVRALVIADIEGDDQLEMPEALTFDAEPGASHHTLELDDDVSYHYDYFGVAA